MHQILMGLPGVKVNISALSLILVCYKAIAYSDFKLDLNHHLNYL
jgi:hypothetical protein